MGHASHQNPIRTAGFCAVLLLSGSAAAQTFIEPESELLDMEVEAPPIYEVEFLIFAYNEFNPTEEEFEPTVPQWAKSLTGIHLRATPETLEPGSADWYLDSLSLPRAPQYAEPIAQAPSPTISPAPGNPVQQAPQALFDEFGNTITQAAQSPDDGAWYHMLDESALELDRAVARLTRLDAYTPLLHAGWSQQTFLEDAAIAFDLGWLGQLQPAGTIRLHRSRFLHLTIDVSLQNDYRYVQEPIMPGARWPLAEFRGPTRYSITTQRRIRSGELHFFDHPAFGILIIVRPGPEVPDAVDPVAIAPAA